jgi:hypothetical protein
MIQTLLTVLLIAMLGHYAYIVPDLILASVATTMVIMLVVGLISNNTKKD